MKKTLRKLIGIIATMFATQALLFWLGAIDQPLWFVASTVLFIAGLWGFADNEREEAR
jgi:hypothetical protein